MTAGVRMLARLCAVFRKPALDRDFAEELAQHLEAATEDNIRAGMTPEEAQRQARIALGGIEQTCELHRDARGLPWLEMERPVFRIEPSERAAIFLKIRASGVAVEPAAVPALRWPDRSDIPLVFAALATEAKTVVTLNPRDFEPAKSVGLKILSPANALGISRHSGKA